MTRRLLLLAILFAPICASAQLEAPASLLKTADLQADAVLLHRAFEQLHPGLYRYNTRPAMDAHFDELNHRLNHDQTLAQAFLAFSVFTAQVRCGHTQLNPFNQSKAVVSALFTSPGRVPFHFVWLGHHMVVTRDFTPGHVLPPGTEVLAINGVPTADILNRLLPITRADGSNENKRIAQLAVTGNSQYDTFDLYFPLLFPQKSSAMAIQARFPGSKHPQTLQVTSLTLAQRTQALNQHTAENPDPNTPLFRWQLLPSGAALLTMPSWALYNKKWNWQPWLRDHMDALAQSNAPALIIDLRGNEGGDDIGNELLPYLIDQPLSLSAMRRFVRYRKAPEDLAPSLDTWDKSFLDWGKSAADLPAPWPTAPPEVPYFQLLRDSDDAHGDLIQPAAHRFLGRVFVLTDASNSSATFQFAQAVQSNHLGTLVGQTTGGSQRGINGGAFFFLRLPHSGLEIDLPLIATFPPIPAPDSGITPDVPVSVTAEDIANDRDPALAAVNKALTTPDSTVPLPSPPNAATPRESRASNPHR